jgi:hypothetical protein
VIAHDEASVVAFFNRPWWREVTSGGNRWPLSDPLWPRTPLTAIKFFAVNSLRFDTNASSQCRRMRRYSDHKFPALDHKRAMRHLSRRVYAAGYLWRRLAEALTINWGTTRATDPRVRQGGKSAGVKGNSRGNERLALGTARRGS